MTSMILPRKKGADMVMTLDTARNPTAAGRQERHSDSQHSTGHDEHTGPQPHTGLRGWVFFFFTNRPD